MLVLLPPSEGKTAPENQGSTPLDLQGLIFSDLSNDRSEMLEYLRAASSQPDASQTLKVGPKLADDVAANKDLWSAATAPAIDVYTGVLFDALGFNSMKPAQRERAGERVLIFSALFGVVRATDHIPAYRMSGMARIPSVGNPATWWRSRLSPHLDDIAHGPIIDCRSQTYAGFWKPPLDNTASVKVLQWHQGQLKVISHHAKYTRGLVARALFEEKAEPTTLAEAVESLRASNIALGWEIKLVPPGEKQPGEIQVILPEAE